MEAGGGGAAPCAASCCLYLYAVFRPPAATEDHLLSGLSGVEGEPDVFAVACENLAAAASPVARSLYNDESLKELGRQLDWIAPRAARHEQVVRRLAAARDVLPLKFATIYSSVERVRAMLREQGEHLTRVLDHVAGREEWGVKVLADAALTEQALAQADPGALALDQQISSASEGEAYFLGKKKQKLLAERSRQWAAEAGDVIYRELLSCAVDARVGRFLNPNPAPADLPVVSAAMLVARDGVSRLKLEAERLEARYREHGIRIELSGPWAPYNFCEVGEKGVRPVCPALETG